MLTVSSNCTFIFSLLLLSNGCLCCLFGDVQLLVFSAESGAVAHDEHEEYHLPPLPSLPLHHDIRPPRNAAVRRIVSSHTALYSLTNSQLPHWSRKANFARNLARKYNFFFQLFSRKTFARFPVQVHQDVYEWAFERFEVCAKQIQAVDIKVVHLITVCHKKLPHTHFSISTLAELSKRLLIPLCLYNNSKWYLLVSLMCMTNWSTMCMIFFSVCLSLK